MSTITFASDCVFIAFVSFILSFASLSYFANFLPSAILSICASLICVCSFILFSKNKRAKIALKKEDVERMKKCKLTLILSDEQDAAATVKRLFDKLGKSPISSKKGFLLSDNRFVRFNFSARGAASDDVVDAYKNSPKNHVSLFIAISFDKSAVDFANRLEKRVKLVEFREFYLALKENDCLPPEKEGLTLGVERKRGALKILATSFDKKKANKFALYGLASLFFGYFSRLKILYLATGSIFLIYALTLKFFAPIKGNPDDAF